MNDQLIEGPAVPGIEVRSVEERIISGRLIPYGEVVEYRGKPEAFARGCCTGLDLSKMKFRRAHSVTVGKAVGWEDRNDGLYVDFKVSRTAAGDETLEMATDGTLDALSPGFIPGKVAADGTHTQLRALLEGSILEWGHYPSAKVLAVRSAKVLAVREKEALMGDDNKGDKPATTPEGAPEGNDNNKTEERAADFSPVEKRMDEMAAGIAKLDEKIENAATAKPGAGPSPVEWFVAELRAAVLGDTEMRQKVHKAIETRALADVTGELGSEGDAGGIVQEQYLASQLVNVLDTRRPFFASLGAFPAPRSGYARIPIVTQHTLVDDRAGQKLEANSQALHVENRSYEARWFDGAVDVALELIKTGDPGVLSLVWDDLTGQYAIKTETDAISIFAADVALGAAHQFAYTGAPLPTDTYGNFASAVTTQAINVRKATGAPATKLAVPEALWPELIAFVDATDRRQFATMGSTNADASVSLTAESFNLPGGITVFVADVPAAALYNAQALRAADYGITRVEALNVTKMGRDVGVLGRTMVVPRIPAGVVVFAATPTT